MVIIIAILLNRYYSGDIFLAILQQHDYSNDYDIFTKNFCLYYYNYHQFMKNDVNLLIC